VTLYFTAHRRDIPEIVVEEKPENISPYTDYTSPSDPPSRHTYSEGDVPLISTTTETESDRDIPFSKKMQLPLDLPPLEDRHKYEKLVQGVDASSDSSDQEEAKAKTQEKVRKRRKISFQEKLQNVYKGKSKTKSENKDDVSVDSDDSIGSASDLKAEDDQTVGEESKEDMQSEDVRTCGSSAYHAECESMATHDEDYTTRIARAKRKQLKAAEEQQQQEEDMIFIGHQYGERPLLADDELDSDCEIQPNTKWDPDKNVAKKESLWIPPSTSFDDSDVFSLAPFNRSKSRKSDYVPYIVSSESFSEPSPLEPPKSLNPFLHEPDFATLVPETESSMVQQPFDIPPLDSPGQATALLIDLSSSSPEDVPPTRPVLEEPKPVRTSISLELKLRKDKKKDSMKSKYQLFSDHSVSDDSPSSFTLPSKSSKGFKSGSAKKSGKSKKTKTLLEEGFSNMSFEDFPSDEREVIPSSELPFEVLRTPSQENRRSGSKKLGNPFS